MTSPNERLVATGLSALRGPLSLFVCRGIEKQYGEPWWTEGVLKALVYDRTPTIEDVRRYRHLPETGTFDECAGSLDISTCLILLTKHWYKIFTIDPMLGKDHRGWVGELIGVRNENKHLAGRDHPSDYAWRALDTMYRLIESIDTEAAGQLLALRSTVDLSAYRHAAAPVGTTAAAAGPHVDVATPEPESALQLQPSVEEELAGDLAAVGPDFSGADLRKMNFAGADLTGANFEGADLTSADLAGAKLVGANFTDATLADADLTTADLTGAHFEGTVLSSWFDKERTYGSQAMAHGADLSGATLNEATLNFAGCDLRSVTFGAINLTGADFEGADLTSADLAGATLRGVNLRNANMTDADLTDVRWT